MGEYLENNDVLVNKEIPCNTSSVQFGNLGIANDFVPKPERWKGPQGGDAFVDKVMLSANSEDFFIIKVSSSGVIEGEGQPKFAVS